MAVIKKNKAEETACCQGDHQVDEEPLCGSIPNFLSFLSCLSDGKNTSYQKGSNQHTNGIPKKESIESDIPSTVGVDSVFIITQGACIEVEVEVSRISSK